MRYILIILCIILTGYSLFGADPVLISDVPEAGVQETLRRGNHAEELGTAQAGQDGLAMSALAPPADDSDRWYLTVVTTKDPRYQKQCELLLRDFDASHALRAWADTTNPKSSWSHFQVRDINDPKQADWFSKNRQQLEASPFPAIIIQPPRNGKFGRNSVTAGMLHGYNGKAEQYSDLIQFQILSYCETISGKPIKDAGGHSQRYSNQPSSNDSDKSRDPLQWPQLKPTALGYKAIKEHCPKAPASWVRETVKSGVTDLDELAELYDEFLDSADTATLAKNTNPSVVPWDIWLVVLLGLIGISATYGYMKHVHTRRPN